LKFKIKTIKVSDIKISETRSGTTISCSEYLESVFWPLTSTSQEEGVATHDPFRKEVLEQQTRVRAKCVLL